jgi:hypothetical protein
MKIIQFTVLLTAIAPIFAQSSATLPKAGAVTAAAIQRQGDLVLDKKKSTEALADQVIAWYEINPKHPGAVEKVKELRGSYKSLLAENMTLLDMMREYRIQTAGDENVDTLLTLSSHVNEVANHSVVDGKVQQLEAMGFDPGTGRFKDTASVQVSSNDNVPNGGSSWATLTSKLSVIFAAWF